MERPVRILVVDDEAMVRAFLEEVLEREGYEVVTADGGEAALTYIAEEEFDLALIDLRMRHVGGMEVLTAIKQQSPDTVAIMLTAYASLETSVEALRQGAHDYLFKPCKTVELRESVRRGLLKREQVLKQRLLTAKLMEERSELDRSPLVSDRDKTLPSLTGQTTKEQERFLQWGGLIIDFMRHVVTLNGRLLELSPTEFDLLAYLASEAPRVVSSQELVREVQGYESDENEARDIVRYHIYRIRQKVKAVSERTDLIRTVRGVGYTIKEAYNV